MKSRKTNIYNKVPKRKCVEINVWKEKTINLAMWLLCGIVKCCSQVAWTSCKVTLDSLVFLQCCLCFHTKQELGLRASLLLIQCLLSLSWYSASFSFYASVCSLWPPLFSLCHSFIPSSLSSFQSVRRNPKGFVLESCSLVLSGTYSLTLLALF